MVTHSIRSAITKLLLFTVAALVFAGPHAQAQTHSTLVIAVDLTQSVATTGPDHQSEFQKNIDSVTRVLSQVPADSRVTVLGITDKSFAQPYIILAATISGDAGYFGERLNAARNGLVRAWQVRSGRLKPEFRYTDIIGALEIASQLFEEQSGTGAKSLFIFSDMRHHTPDLDLESCASVKRFPRAANRTDITVVDLRGVQVHALGVDASGKTTLYWQALHKFWSEYFAEAGANLKEYSSIRTTGDSVPIELPRGLPYFTFVLESKNAATYKCSPSLLVARVAGSCWHPRLYFGSGERHLSRRRPSSTS